MKNGLFLRIIEEAYFKQKSRVNWLKERDQNTTYFYRMFRSRVSYNSIRSFLLPNGELITDPMAMSLIAINQFQSILRPQHQHRSLVLTSSTWFHSLSQFRLQPADQALMCSIPSQEEITSIILKLNPNKAPGLDGLTSGFYKAAWNVFGT